MGTSLTKFRLFFYEVTFITDTHFPRLHETLFSGRVKLSAAALRYRSPVSISPLLKRWTQN